MFILFLAFAFIVIMSAMGVLLFKNALHSALCLILNLLTVACLFAMMDAHFLAAVQIIVYAGAIMVLTLFVIMLLNTKVESFDAGTVVMAIVGGGLGVVFVMAVAPLFEFPMVAQNQLEPTQAAGAAEMGVLLFDKYVLPFQLAGLMLLAALVGSAMLAKTRTHKGEG